MRQQNLRLVAVWLMVVLGTVLLAYAGEANRLA